MYATVAQLKARLEIGTATSDTTLQDALDWATDWIDTFTQREFTAGTETRYFDAHDLDPNDRALLCVDNDLLSVGTLTNGDDDATALGSATYWLWPRNETPAWGIRLKSSYSWQVETDCFIKITGTWGYSATPPALVEGACLRLAEWRYRSKDMLDTTTIFSEQATRVRPPAFPSEVEESLAPLRKLA